MKYEKYRNNNNNNNLEELGQTVSIKMFNYIYTKKKICWKTEILIRYVQPNIGLIRKLFICKKVYNLFNYQHFLIKY